MLSIDEYASCSLQILFMAGMMDYCEKKVSVQTKKVCLNLRITGFFTNFDWFYAV